MVKVLLLNGDEEYFKSIESEKQYIIVPTLSDDKLVSYVEDQLQIYLAEVILHFCQEVQRLKYTHNHHINRNDMSSMVLFNMREEKISDQAKMKKRKMGRQYKIMGDLALLVLSPTVCTCT